ncbi:MAG: hypothetical protein WA021_00105 [Minisyncoccia bacterium]
MPKDTADTPTDESVFDKSPKEILEGGSNWIFGLSASAIIEVLPDPADKHERKEGINHRWRPSGATRIIGVGLAQNE